MFIYIAQKNLLHVRSVLPAITPVNFATMATGAPSDIHNIRDRSEPLIIETIFLVLSESATASRASSTVGILLSKFANYKGIAESNLDEDVVNIMLDLVKQKTPRFILTQLLDIDDTGHKFGLESDEFKTSLSVTDKRLGKILPCLAKEGYGLIMLADHGVHQAENKATHDGSTEDDMIVPLTWC